MDLEELINRPDTEVIYEQEAIFVVEEYLRVRKGRSVRINPCDSPFQYKLLVKALSHAVAWFRCERLNNK
jgi:hypothetical protein